MEAGMHFAKDEKVLCFHGPLMYEAKVLKAEVRDAAEYGEDGNTKIKAPILNEFWWQDRTTLCTTKAGNRVGTNGRPSRA